MTNCRSGQKTVGVARIVSNEAFAPGMYALVLAVADLFGGVRPGQFVEIGLRQPDLVLPRPFSVFRQKPSSSGSTGRSFGGDVMQLEIRYQVLGEGTKRLSEMSVGTELDVIGPLGNSWPVADDTTRALVVSGGCGAAPLAMLITELDLRGISVTMIQGARSECNLFGQDGFSQHAARHIVATDDGSCGHHGLVTKPLAEVLSLSRHPEPSHRHPGLDPGPRSFDVAYVCGPEPMMEACAKLCLDAGITTWVSLERRMACGVGACLSCVVPTSEGLKRVCADGPIFNAEEVLWHI